MTIPVLLLIVAFVLFVLAAIPVSSRVNLTAAGLAFATAAGRAVLTFNRRHFIRLHAEVSSHAGIIVCTRDDDVVALANRIHQQLQGTPILLNQLLRVNRPSS